MAWKRFAEQGCSSGQHTAEEQIVQRIGCRKLEKEVRGEWCKARSRQTRNPPRSDNFDVRLKAIEGKFETNLIVALARATMRDETTTR
jgi:hypothetical protein